MFVCRCSDLLTTPLTTAAVMFQLLVLRGNLSLPRKCLLRAVRGEEVPGAGLDPTVHLVPCRRPVPRQRVHHPRPQFTLRGRAA